MGESGRRLPEHVRRAFGRASDVPLIHRFRDRNPPRLFRPQRLPSDTASLVRPVRATDLSSPARASSRGSIWTVSSVPRRSRGPWLTARASSRGSVGTVSPVRRRAEEPHDQARRRRLGRCRVTLGKDWGVKHIPFGKRPKKLPTVLFDEEARRLLQCLHNPKHHAVLLVCYAAGLRLSEATHLRVADIDGARGQLNIRHGKGRKARVVPASKARRTGRVIRRTWSNT